MPTSVHHHKRQPRIWLVPAIVAAILFIGGVAGNLIANYIQASLDPYKRWVWVSFGIALFVAIAVAIKESRRGTHPIISDSEEKPERKLASGRRSAAIDDKVQGSVIRPGSENVAVVKGKVEGDVFRGDKVTHIHEATSAAVSALHQLPPPVSDFTGRETELVELTAKLEQGGVTISGLHGLGGIGKTALALKLADGLKRRYPNAQFYLDLKGASRQPLTVSEALAHVIRAYHPTAKLPGTEAELQGLYQSVLHDQRALLLMDNAASAEQVEPLIPQAGCVLLVTSRQHFTLPGLFAKNLEALSREDARKLLLAIAPRIGGLAEEIAGLCGHLPLALRLAGSALVTFDNLSPTEYARRLQNEQLRLKLIEASLNLSYELLSEELQKWWRLLAVFPDTFEENAAAAVWSLEVDKSQDVLGELISASMVDYNELSCRYQLHDLARLFAVSRLGAEERATGQVLHATHYHTVLAAAGQLYLNGGEAVRGGLTLFDLEWRNIEAGQAWAESEAAGNDQAAQLVSGYPDAGAYVLNLRQYPRERIRWLEVAVGAARRLGQRGREGNALGNLGNAYAHLGETRRAIDFHQQYLIISREIGDRRGEGNALGNLGLAYSDLGETKQAIDFYEQALLVVREIGNRRGEGTVLGNLGMAYADLGDSRRAIRFNEQRLVIGREIGDRQLEGAALVNLGSAYADLGEIRQAIEFYEQDLVIAREIGDRRGEGVVLGNLGLAYADLGEIRQAIEFYEQDLVIAREVDDRRGEGVVLGNLGLAYVDLDEIDRAIEFYEQSLVIAREIGNRGGEGATLGNLGSAYLLLGETGRAIELYEQRLAIAREIGDRRGESNVLWNISLALDVLGERARAIVAAEEALTICDQIEDPSAVKVRAQLDLWREETSQSLEAST